MLNLTLVLRDVEDARPAARQALQRLSADDLEIVLAFLQALLVEYELWKNPNELVVVETRQVVRP